MWTLIIGLALAGTSEDLAAELPDALAQLQVCEADGCDRSDGARAAFLVAMGSYLQSGEADGAAAATVQALDKALFAELPDVLQAAATAPMAWATRVGGQPSTEPPSVVKESRLAQFSPDYDKTAARVFVLTEMDDRRGWDHVKTSLRIRVIIARIEAKMYPAGDLCQQATLSTALTNDLDAEPPFVGTLSFDRWGAFDTRDFATNYQAWVGGREVILTNGQGQYRLPAGEHQVALLRVDGVGPVMSHREPSPESIRHVRDEAEQCIRSAMLESPQSLAPHFERLSARMPGVELYVARSVSNKARDVQIWKWQNGEVEQVHR